MSAVILMMIIISLLLAALAACGVIWGLRSGQFGEQAAFLQLRDEPGALEGAILLEQRAADFAAPGLLLLDRDGVINEDLGYVGSIKRCKIIPDALQLAICARQAGWIIAVVSNQSGIARGYFTAEDVERLHGHLAAEFARVGGDIRAWYFCPHGPQDGCKCRKPSPAMLQTAMSELQKRPEQCIMCGDKLTDMQAAERAGIQKRYLIASAADYKKVIDENFAPRE